MSVFLGPLRWWVEFLGIAQRHVVSQILIAGKDWQSRALLRAQLLEEGFEVEALEAIPEALAALGAGTNLPGLLIADISASDDPSPTLRCSPRGPERFPSGSSPAEPTSSRGVCAAMVSKWSCCALWTWVNSWTRSSRGWRRIWKLNEGNRRWGESITSAGN